MIPFNEPVLLDSCLTNVSRLRETKHYSGDGSFTKRCHAWFEERLPGAKVLLTTSCTHALEIMAMLIDINPGDEVILPSYTFVSTANAFALRGAKLIFVDIRQDTMNLDASLVASAITEKTKAIVIVHYAGVACDMNKLKTIADEHGVYLLEDAAQGMMSTYRNRPLGVIGQLGTFSFHESKNYQCGEGGLLIINDPTLLRKAEIIREKGTDRSAFFRGEVDKYTWRSLGSSYLLSELNAAFLFGQLEHADMINEKRLSLWNAYYAELKDLGSRGLIELPVIPDDCIHNAHMFFVKLRDQSERALVTKYLNNNGINAVTHYVPLHSSDAGKVYGRFHGEDRVTSRDAERLLRLPLYYNLTLEEVRFGAGKLKQYWGV